MYQFLSGSATGHVITGVSAVVGFAAKLVYDKIETTSKQLTASQAAAQAETKKELQSQSKQLTASQAAAQAETTKELTAAQAENTKRFDKLDFVLSSVAPQMAAMETNIAWMRGDYGVVNRGHRPANEATKPHTDEALEDEDSSAGTNP